MKISPDQNTITLDDGTVLVAVEVADFYSDETPSCDGCYFNDENNGECLADRNTDIDCSAGSAFVIFIKEQKND